MTIIHPLPIIAGCLAVMFMLYNVFKDGEITNHWVVPALISILFFAFSIASIMSEGPLGFWAEHTRNMWGNQIWFDLLIAVCIGWFFITPKAKALGMKLLPWGLIVLSTGCIGFTAMVARMLYLQERRTNNSETIVSNGRDRLVER